jgi:hypothetical protein
MEQAVRQRFVASAVPIIIAAIAAQRAAPHVRTVDFVLLFASGVAFGVGLTGLIRAWKARG